MREFEIAASHRSRMSRHWLKRERWAESSEAERAGKLRVAPSCGRGGGGRRGGVSWGEEALFEARKVGRELRGS